MYNHDKQVYNLIMYNHDKQTTLDSDSERGQSPQRAVAPDDDDELMMNNVFATLNPMSTSHPSIYSS